MEKRRIDTFDEAVDYLYNMPRFTEKHSMEDTRGHLARLGSPDSRIRNIIHVAGTNGKGSVCTYLRYCLETAGYRVGEFTSPHLVDIRERFVYDGEMISKEEFLRFFLLVYESLDWEQLEGGTGYHPTFFEFLFFMCMLYFAEKQPDYCILETGLGGRLDATNAVERKAMTVITRIGLDHVEYLGNTIAEIAAEKAGILRENTPLVYCAEVEEATEIFEKKAEKMGILAVPVSKKDYCFRKFHNKTIDFSLGTRYYGYVGVSLHTIAHYQMENAAIAVRALEILREQSEHTEENGQAGGLRLTKAQIQDGLARAFWPGRMEEILPEVFADGAHNADGIRAFLETVARDDCEAQGRGRILVFSVVQDKDYRTMIKQVLSAGLFEKIFVAHMHTARAAETEKLRTVWTETAARAEVFGFRVREGEDLFFADDVRTALEEALAAQNDARIYIAGSLYLVGEIKEFYR